MNRTQLREYLTYYHPYVDYNPKWANWYINVAPLKGKRTVKILKKYKGSKARLLDCGCGIGLSLYYLSQYFKNSIGAETDGESFEIAKKQFKKLKCRAKLKFYDGVKLPFPDNHFDIVTSMEVWEHAEDTSLMLREIRRVLKPDGILHITTANKFWPIEPHYKLPFLSYLPYVIADRYVRITKRAKYYHDIHLPAYGQFKKSIDEYFRVSDITLEMLISYKYLGFDKERGNKIILVAKILQILKLMEKIPVLSLISRLVNYILVRISLGWLFIAYPKKVQNENYR